MLTEKPLDQLTLNFFLWIRISAQNLLSLFNKCFYRSRKAAERKKEWFTRKSHSIQKTSKRSKICIMMVGPSLESKGGISQVVDDYINSGMFNNLSISYFPTYSEGKRLKKITFYFFNKLKIIIWMHMVTR